MERFDERVWLEEAYRKMAEAERRAGVQQALTEFRHSKPSHKQRLARMLVGVASWLSPGDVGKTAQGCASFETQAELTPCEPCA